MMNSLGGSQDDDHPQVSASIHLYPELLVSVCATQRAAVIFSSSALVGRLIMNLELKRDVPRVCEMLPAVG